VVRNLPTGGDAESSMLARTPGRRYMEPVDLTFEIMGLRFEIE
jgi:hypothetical protein